jgi:thiol:disulfide interchange protein DsbD
LTLVAFAAWLWGRSQGAVGGAGWLGAARTQALVAAVALLAGLAIAWPSSPSGRLATALGAAGAAAQASSPAESTIEWEPYSDQRLAELRRQGRPVFVDFTAAWCLSCQVNKRTSLKTELVRERMHALDVVPLEADWTNANPEITAALGRLQRNAVPVYAVYPKDGSAPRLLPEVLTPQLVLEALREAAGR